MVLREQDQPSESEQCGRCLFCLLGASEYCLYQRDEIADSSLAMSITMDRHRLEEIGARTVELVLTNCLQQRLEEARDKRASALGCGEVMELEQIN